MPNKKVYRDRFTDLRPPTDADKTRDTLNAAWFDNPSRYFAVVKPGWRCAGCGTIKMPDTFANGSWIAAPFGTPMLHLCDKHTECYDIVPLP